MRQLNPFWARRHRLVRAVVFIPVATAIVIGKSLKAAFEEGIECAREVTQEARDVWAIVWNTPTDKGAK